MKVLMVHQSAELYGSDRSFLSSVAAIKESNAECFIKVLVPCDGPLTKELELVCDEIEISTFAVLRKSNLKKAFFSEIVKHITTFFFGLNEFKKYDVIYLNTIVLFPFILASRWHKKSIVHIRDIAPGFLMNFFRFTLKFSRSKFIFNSHYLKKYFDLNGSVVHNGVAGATEKKYVTIKKNTPLKIIFVGRINGWKGLDLLLKALSAMNNGIVDSLTIYGDCYEGQEMYLEEAEMLAKDIKNVPIHFMGFANKVIDVIGDFDLLIVPSKEPEPFGRVVIEAMSSGTPSLIAGHGGMLELVVENETGFVFKPNEINSLKLQITNIYENSALLEQVGKNSRITYEEKFSEITYMKNLAKVFNEIRG